MKIYESERFELDVPEDDDDYDAFMTNFIEVASANQETLGLTGEDIAQLKTNHEKWQAHHAACQATRREVDRTEAELAATYQREAMRQSTVQISNRASRENSRLPH